VESTRQAVAFFLTGGNIIRQELRKQYAWVNIDNPLLSSVWLVLFGLGICLCDILKKTFRSTEAHYQFAGGETSNHYQMKQVPLKRRKK